MGRAQGMYVAVKFPAEARCLFSSRLVTSPSLLESLMEIPHCPLLVVCPLLAPLLLSLPAWPHACPALLLQRGGLGSPDMTLFWETHFSKTHWADGDLITLRCRKSHEKAIIPGYLWPHDRSALQGEKRNGQSTWKGIFFLLLKSGTKGCEDGLSSAEPADTQPSELNGKSYECTEWELLAKTWGEHGCRSASVRNTDGFEGLTGRSPGRATEKCIRKPTL